MPVKISPSRFQLLSRLNSSGVESMVRIII
jgi:hypothetical protein